MSTSTISKYPYIGDHVRIHQLPTGGILQIDYQNPYTSAADFEYLDLNQTAYEICMQLDGTKSVDEILFTQCQKYNESIIDHEDWYYELIEMLVQKSAIKFSDSSNKIAIQTSGSSKFPMPLHATFELTHKCNLKCAHCYLESSPQLQGGISFENFKRLADILYDNGVLTCEITGGEVFVHPNANEILSYALNKFKKIALLTNGTLIRKKSIDLLLPFKDKIIIGISLDSIHPKVHDEFRGKQGAFEQTCKNIKLLSELGFVVRVAMSVFEENMWEIHEMASLVKDLGAKMFTYNWVDDFGRGKSMEHPTNNKEVLIKYLEYEDNLLKEYKDIIPIIPYSKKNADNCGAGWRSIVIDPFGNVRPCALFPKTFSLGNVINSSYEDVFSSEMVTQLWRLQAPRVSKNCQDGCPFNQYCGGCYLKGLNANKNHRSELCSWTKNEKLENIVSVL